jgi:hypothetical protein
MIGRHQYWPIGLMRPLVVKLPIVYGDCDGKEIIQIANQNPLAKSGNASMDDGTDLLSWLVSHSKLSAKEHSTPALSQR